MTSSFFLIDNFRDIVDIPDALDDPELLKLGVLASGSIDTALFPYIGETTDGSITPLTGDNLKLAQNLCSLKTGSLWKAKKQNKDLAKYYNDLYEDELKKFILKLQATRTSRTKRVSVTTDYKTQQLFSQSKKF